MLSQFLHYTGKDTPPEVVPERAAIVRRIFEEFAAGYDRLGIARRLNAEGYRTDRGTPFEQRVITYILKNPFYIGKIRWNYRVHGSYRANPDDQIVITDGQHQPIIAQELWDAAQARVLELDRLYTSRRRSPSTTKHWLSGMMYCSACGHTLGYNHNCGKSSFFNCCEYSKGKCSVSHGITAKKAERLVLEALDRALTTGEARYIVQPPETRSDGTKAALRALEIKERRAKSAYLAGIDTLEEYREARDAIRREREALEQASRPAPQTVDVMTKIASVRDALMSDALTTEQKGNALRSVVQKIVYDRPAGELHIFYYA